MNIFQKEYPFYLRTTAAILFTCLIFPAANVAAQATKSATEKSMEKQGMVTIASVDSTILVSLMYTRADNFTGQVLYKDLNTAYLHPKAAAALHKAQQILRRSHPGLTLKVYDAARPMSVQQRMWNVVAGTPKNIYVSNPANGGGLHNYGLAVDVTIADANGDSITMGTRIDNMTRLAHIDKEDELLRQGKLTREAYNNRRLLRRVMREAGFRALRSEWWHFNYTSRANARKYYKVIR
jgi:D-alanyl-D-alanine dipeptidase